MSIRSVIGQGCGIHFIQAALCGLILTLGGCEDEPVKRDYPRVRTLDVTNITASGATFVAEVYDEGNIEVAEHGFAWSTGTPDLSGGEKTYLGSFIGTGTFEANITTTLSQGVTYYVGAFVKAGEYTVYGEVIKFISLGSGAPEITDFTPKSAGWYDTVTITGRNFSYNSGTNRILIDDHALFPIYSSDTLLKFLLPFEGTKLLNTVAVSIAGNVATASSKLTLLPPDFYDFAPVSGYWGDTITFTGRYLGFMGYTPSDGMLLNGSLLCKTVKRNYDSASFIIPGQLTSLSSTVSIAYKSFNFTFPETLTLLPPEADSIKPAAGTWGTMVTLYGKFNFMPELNKVLFDDKEAEIISSSRDSMIVKVPATLAAPLSAIKYSSGPFTQDFVKKFKLKVPEIYDFQPKAGYAGNIVTLRGKYFRKDISTVEVGGKPVFISSVNDTIITFYVPGDIYGNCSVVINSPGFSVTAGDLFNATNHIITGIQPIHVNLGDTVTVTGKHFRTEMVLYMDNVAITHVLVSEQELKFVVPPWMDYNYWSGSVTAKCEYYHSPYTIISSFTYQDHLRLNDFTLTDITPLSGKVGDLLVISGTNLGSHLLGVTFENNQAQVTESTSTQITVRVPRLSAGEHYITVSLGVNAHTYPYKYIHSGPPWRRLDNLSFHNYGSFVFDFGDEVYVATREETSIFTKEIYRFNPSLMGFNKLPGTWQSEIIHPISCTLGGKGYVIGFRGFGWAQGLEVFNPDLLTWEVLPDYPGTWQANVCFMADDSVIYAGCGKDRVDNIFTWYRDFWKYSPKTNKWTRLADSPLNVSFTNHAFIDGRLLFLGFKGVSSSRYLLEYLPLTNTWSQAEIVDNDLGSLGLNDMKYGARASVVSNGKWYIGFGDYYQSFERVVNYSSPIADVNNRYYCFDPVLNDWKTFTDVDADPRTFPLAFTYNGMIYIGGSQVDPYKYDFWEHNPLKDQ